MKPYIGSDATDPTAKAFYRLKNDPACTGEDREAMKVAFLSTNVGDWAYRALARITDWSQIERDRLFLTLEKSGSVDSVIWTLTDVEITAEERSKLVRLFTNGVLKRQDNARRLLREAGDHLSEDEKSKLKDLAAGRDF